MGALGGAPSSRGRQTAHLASLDVANDWVHGGFAVRGQVQMVVAAAGVLGVSGLKVEHLKLPCKALQAGVRRSAGGTARIAARSQRAGRARVQPSRGQAAARPVHQGYPQCSSSPPSRLVSSWPWLRLPMRVAFSTTW